MPLFLQAVLNGVLVSLVLIALGISVVYATTRIFHLAHGAVIVGAAYAFWWAYSVLGLNLFLAIALSVFAAAVSALLMNELVYERLRRLGTKGLGYLIATLALLMLGTGIVLLLFGAAPKTLRVQPPTLTFAEVNVTTFQLWDLLTVAVLALTYFWIVRYTKLGKAMRATSDNEEMAEVVGIDTKKIRRTAFILSAVLGAAAGVLGVAEYAVDPNMAVLFAVRGFTAAVIGGVGSLPGTIIGSLLIGLTEQGVVWFMGAGFRNAATFLLLFLFLLFKPSGLFGTKREM